MQQTRVMQKPIEGQKSDENRMEQGSQESKKVNVEDFVSSILTSKNFADYNWFNDVEEDNTFGIWIQKEGRVMRAL